MIKNVTKQEFEQEVTSTSSDKLILVDFWAPWCGPCRTMNPILEEFAAENTDKITVLKVNTDNEPDLAEEHGIWSIPTMAIYENGEEIKRHVGVATKSHMERSFLGKGSSFFIGEDPEDHSH